MAVGLSPPADLLSVAGVRAAVCSAGIYNKQRDDLTLFAVSEGAAVSAMFTGNRFYAAPVAVAREHIKNNNVRYLLVNAGNANAGTGIKGVEDAKLVCKALAEQAGCNIESVLPFSTGVIGEYLPVDNIRNALPGLFNSLTDDAWLDCAKAIMTTDTLPKGLSRQFMAGDELVTVTGIAKGSGMINPDMATMLAFIATDASVEQLLLDQLLLSSAGQSFNKICVDGDTSTNDACVLIATGKNPLVRITSRDSQAYGLLEENIKEICIRLAQAIVRDAEGATKFITIQVDNANSEGECFAIANSLSTSPLVKTALYASDPNWGRILAAIGRSDIDRLETAKVTVCLNDVCIVENGARAKDYTEEAGVTAMQDNEIVIRVDLNRGKVSSRHWTCDLSHEYVAINAEYRT